MIRRPTLTTHAASRLPVTHFRSLSRNHSHKLQRSDRKDNKFTSTSPLQEIEMNSSTRYYAQLAAALGLYFAVSKAVFDRVYQTSQTVVDELFHIPQGVAFCEGNFSRWDSKITTLPGLHLTSAVVGYWLPCSTYNLRFVNLLASCGNLALFASILTFVYAGYNERPTEAVLQALSLALLPPLYFFSHVYYTDTLALLYLLAFSRLCFGNTGRGLIMFAGSLSVLMRQTNVVWVAMFFGHKVLDILLRSSRVYGNQYLSRTAPSPRSSLAHDVDSSKLKRYYGLPDVAIALKFHARTRFRAPLRLLSFSDAYVLAQQLGVLLAFALFVRVNGALAVGDHAAHRATLHLPQLLYFLLFYGLFGLPFVLARLRSTARLVAANRWRCAALCGACALLAHCNTLVHPYLLADNRHYTFYVWSRWFARYELAACATAPLYVLLLASLYDNLREQNCVSFLLPYCVSLFLALALQRLVEIRYFLVPYIILRLRFARPSRAVLCAELLWYVAINAVTFYIFFTKEIKWKDFEDPQRLIW